MENIAPSLILIWDVKRSLEKGQSVAAGVKAYLARPLNDDFRLQIERWWLSQNNTQIVFVAHSLSLHRRHLVELLEMGLNGHGVLATLQELETEFILSCEGEIEEHVRLLPLVSLVPLMLFIFPSLVILLVSPLLKLLQF